MKGKFIIGTPSPAMTARNPGVAQKQVKQHPAAGRKYGPRRPIKGAPAHVGERRCSRAQASDRVYLARQVPRGYRFATNYREFLEALEYAMDAAMFQERRRRTTRAVVKDLFRNQNYDAEGKSLFTCSTSWEDTDERCGVKRGAYYDAWNWLVRDAKLLLWIAWAREEEWKPAYLQGKKGEEGSDRGLYGFILPNVEAEEKPPANSPVDNQQEVPVDKKGTVTGFPGSSNTPQHAGASIQAPASQRKKAFASLRCLTKGGSAALRRLLLDRKAPLPAPGETAKRLGSARPSRESQALFAASVIAELPSPLSKISPQHLASILRKYKIYDADWTVNDVLYALKTRPPGEGEWRRQDAVRHVGGWVAFRLSAWSGPDGRPLSSKSQRDREYQEQAQAQAVEAAKQAAIDKAIRERNAAVARGEASPGPGKLAFLAQRAARRERVQRV